MRFIPTTPGSVATRPARLITLVALVALVTSAMTGPAASREPDGRTSSPEPDEPTAAELAEVHAAVGEAEVDGLAWYTDAATGEVVVTADSTVSAAERNAVRKEAGAGADDLTIKRVDGVFKPMLAMYSGNPVYGRSTRCSLGFNVRSGAKHYFITAGHCGNKVSMWYANSSKTKRIGPTVGSWYPNNDYALVKYDPTGLKRPGGYILGHAWVGRGVTREGSTTGRHSGTITAVNVTVRYGGGIVVRGMIQADICAEPGDSGGPLYRGRRAIGITSGGAGDCPSGGITFYQPVAEVVKAYGVKLY
ncbi:S1 family peptidase [Promicromonospora soli]|uniref:Serine protease n=1 Tax=Promicromonospora soli TaxID=2035533 RepID=A0A919KN29_9MICO|nr:S1 family peptidase [Promicromonospora soli]GHH64947.1 serine protease [Promicromonospora soli]